MIDTAMCGTEGVNMQSRQRSISSVLALAALLTFSPAWGHSVNKSIKIDDNATSSGGSTVNGSISVGTGATVSGSLETVNGTIKIGNQSTVTDAETVNGSLKLGDGVKATELSSVNGSVNVGKGSVVSGDVSVVNGKISLKSGATVSDNVSNVNGAIRLTSAEIGADLTTVTGDVTLEDKSTVKGTLRVEKPKGWGNSKNRKPKVVIGPGSRVEGGIDLEHEVELYISDTAEVSGVTGVMSMDDAKRFSGARP